MLKRLYGSEARGEVNDKSDIDLLVLVPKDKVTLQDGFEITAPLYDIGLKTGVLINALILLKREWSRIIGPFYDNLIQDAVDTLQAELFAECIKGLLGKN